MHVKSPTVGEDVVLKLELLLWEEETQINNLETAFNGLGVQSRIM